METLSNLQAFVQSAECGSFSGAARRLGLTPAGVSRSVAMLERNLGLRLFHRSTRKLRLTEAGERFLISVVGPLDQLQGAITTAAAGLGLGVALLAMSEVVADLDAGRLIRLLPDWYAEAGGISVYYASKSLLPAKTRDFIDWIDAEFHESRLSDRFDARQLLARNGDP